MNIHEMSHRKPYISVALISAASLAYEILLIRLFSIIQWHHFAYMVIALALLGYGFSGTFISIFRQIQPTRFRFGYLSSLLLFGFTSVLCFLVAQNIPFNAEEILWDNRQAVYLLYIFLLLTVPFFFAASAICLSLIHYQDRVAQLYAADLAGAGLGSVGIVMLLYVVFPQTALILVAITALASFSVACLELRINFRLPIAFGVLFFAGFLIEAFDLPFLNISPYKSQEQMLLVSGTKVIARRSSPLGLLSVIGSDNIPLRHAPGLSLNSRQEPLQQLSVFTDGDNMSVITRHTEDRSQLSYLDQMTTALPYHLKQMQQVLILGAGGGSDILLANFHDAQHIDAVEMNQQLIELIRGPLKDFTGALYQQKQVSVHPGEARNFLTGNLKRYDLIQLALMDAFNASASGLYALNESYLYTVEGLKLYLDHLKPDGILAITRWIKMPPRDTLKLVATAVDAMRQAGFDAPGQQLVLIRSWQTSTLLVKNGVFTNSEIESIQTFCDQRWFDIAYVPGISRNQINRYNQLDEPYFYSGITSILGQNRQTFMDRYKFNLQPATDDQPYFHHFFKWSSLPELFKLRKLGGMSLLESGYIVFMTTLIIALSMSLLLILTPLWFFRGVQIDQTCPIKKSHVIIYFFAIGLAFLFIEMAFIQKFILFLPHPIFSIALTLAIFLLFSGLGSYFSSRLARKYSLKATLILAVTGITLLCLNHLLLLDTLFNLLFGLDVVLKILVTLLLIAPLAFFMGMPFPLALNSLSEQALHYIPWAWGINGCASVISAVLATLLAIHFGFTVVILLALMLYAVIIFFFPSCRNIPSS